MFILNGLDAKARNQSLGNYYDVKNKMLEKQGLAPIDIITIFSKDLHNFHISCISNISLKKQADTH